MKATLHQPPMPTQRPHARRFKVRPVCVAFLLVLPAVGLGLVARTAVPAALVSGTQDNEVRVGRDDFPRNQIASPSGSLQEILAHPDVIPTHHHPLLGRQAPDFDLADPEGKVWNLGELRNGQPVVLIFYYGYHCVGCVRQLFEVNRDLPLFRDVGARVIAISADPPELTRQRFEQNGPFGFPVLSDPGNAVARGYRVVKEARDGTTADFLRHGIFILDRNGTIRWVNVGDAPFRRNPALLYQLAKLEGRLPPPPDDPP